MKVQTSPDPSFDTALNESWLVLVRELDDVDPKLAYLCLQGDSILIEIGGERRHTRF